MLSHVPVALAQPLAAACPSGTGPVCRLVQDATGNQTLARVADRLVVTPARILVIVLLALAAGFVVRRLVRRFTAGLTHEGVRRRLGALWARAPRSLHEADPITSVRRVQRAETIGAVLRSIGIAAVWTVAVMAILSEVGVDAGPLIAGAGILGVALGFGAQNLIRDFLSGIFMLVEDQYGVGDVIDVGHASGQVEAVTLRSTRLRDVDGTLWHVPNGEIRRVGNKSQGWSRALLDVEVPLEVDIAAAMAVIERAADGLWRDKAGGWSQLILEEPEVWGGETLTQTGVAIRVVVKTRPLEQWKVARELRARIKAALDAARIGLAQPAVLVRNSADEEEGEGAAGAIATALPQARAGASGLAVARSGAGTGGQDEEP